MEITERLVKAMTSVIDILNEGYDKDGLQIAYIAATGTTIPYTIPTAGKLSIAYVTDRATNNGYLNVNGVNVIEYFTASGAGTKIYEYAVKAGDIIYL